MNYKILLFKIFFFLLYTNSIIAFQGQQDFSNHEESYQYLTKKFYENEKDTVIAKKYAKKYLLKAKKEDNSINIIHGYYFMSLISESAISHKYSDTIISFTKNKNSSQYPIYSYRQKAVVYFNDGDFKNAFDYFLKVNEEAKKYDNIGLQYSSKKSIGILKGWMGENETALVNLRDCYPFFSKYKKDAPEQYLELLFALSESYNFNKILDSASVINSLGYKESLELERSDFQRYFILNEGINQFSKEKYTLAKDSLVKAIDLLKKTHDLANLGQAHYYLGKSYAAIGMLESAIEEHKLVDVIFQKSPQIIPESRKSYEILINHYKEINDTDNQLKYIERLLKVDSVLNSNYKYLIKNVIQNYDTPKLIAEKQQIINSLEKENRFSLFWMGSIIILCVISIVVLGSNYVKNKKYKKRFNELYSATNSDENSNKEDLIIAEKDTIGIDETLIKEILQRLEEFESKSEFLRRNITTNSLAKSFDTNSKYLSKVINRYKKKNFNTYINELRIEYVIDKLKTDRKFKKYSIRAIANEIGFNSTEVFSKAFYKKNGIHPSYFIKQLEKHEQD
ncbi:helix-turn-helix domain-containing protein [uncultured Aquimarina sp.]|uniref:helix-turn-helix domain-containing protein n=1 Tax=uncultured Aquimarina sp. TaxID=575652 RepID=UPI002603264A|nr:helix-turn-helix domain-containing protein [uncultured Aquimarina sp.]